MVLESADLPDNGLQVLPDLFSDVAVGNVLHGSQSLASGFVMPTLVSLDVSLYRVQPPQNLSLHDEDGFQHLISFGHAVAPFGCVGTPNVTGNGMALYIGGGVA